MKKNKTYTTILEVGRENFWLTYEPGTVFFHDMINMGRKFMLSWDHDMINMGRKIMLSRELYSFMI